MNILRSLALVCLSLAIPAGICASVLALRSYTPPRPLQGQTEKLAEPEDGSMNTATFAAGCFWGVEADFRDIEGVTATVVGYTGGTTETPTYKQVCSGTTGHAEALRVTFDPDLVSYQELVRAFFNMHDPTSLNRQGPDRGSQYRSAIFVHSEEQRRQAEAIRDELDASDSFQKPIVTQIADAGPFFRAEEYHQRYYEKNAGIRCR